MRYLTCILAAFCISAGTTYAADEPLSTGEQEVVNVIKARLEASDRGDATTWARYVADDLIYGTDDGALVTKANMMAQFAKPASKSIRLVDPRAFVVHVLGNTAVADYRLTVREQFGDVDITTELRRTETFLKQNGAWLLFAVQETDLPINHRKPVAIDPSVLKDYVGQYQSRPAQVHTVFVKDGKLWSQIGAEPEECLPAGSDTFFFKDDLGSETYSRDADGHVNGYTYTFADGQQTHARKIK